MNSDENQNEYQYFYSHPYTHLNELHAVLPNKRLIIFVGSFNMNGKIPSNNLDSFLRPKTLIIKPHMYAIHTQETQDNQLKWNANIQQIIGSDYIPYYSAGLGTLYSTFFAHKKIIWYFSRIEHDVVSIRFGQAFKTKGSVCVSLMFFGTSFLFINAHLTAHQEKINDRIADIKKIFNHLQSRKQIFLKNSYKSVLKSFNYCFICGDLNFRLNQTKNEIIKTICTNKKYYEKLIEYDQLTKVINEGLILKNFYEDKITFLPTYKYNIGTNDFDTSLKQRIPSYTDRILYTWKKECRHSKVKSLGYHSATNVLASDHKPIWACFEVEIKPCYQNEKYSIMNKFNKDIYEEGTSRKNVSYFDKKSHYSKCILQ